MEENISKAREMRDKGEFSSAAIYYRSALQAEPGNGEIRWEFGKLQLALLDGESALIELERAERQGSFGSPLSLDIAHALLLSGEFEKATDKLSEVDASQYAGKFYALHGHINLGQGKLGQAIATYGQSLKIEPESAEGRLGVAQIAMGRGDHAEALTHIARGLVSNPYHIQLLLLKGEISLEDKQIEVANQAFEAVLKLSPSQGEARLGVAQTLLLQGKMEQADEYLAQLSEGNNQNPRINWAQAVSAHQKKDMANALLHLRQILQIDPNFLLALRLKAQILYEQGEFKQAEAPLAHYLKIASGDVESFKLMAGIQLGLQQPKQAVLTLLKVASAAPDDADLLAILGTAFWQSGDLEQGLHYFMLASTLDPEAKITRSRVDLLQVLAHIRNGEYEKARVAAGTLEKKYPGNPAPSILKGSIWEAEDDLVKAREQYKLALDIKPGDGIVLLRLAQLELRANNKKTAQQYLASISSEGSPVYSHSLVLRARLKAEAGQFDRSIALLEQANKIDANAVLSRIMLAGHYALQGRAKEALQVAEQAYKLAPNHRLVVLAVARARLDAGKPQEALSILAPLAAALPNLIGVQFELAQVLAAVGDVQRAKLALTRVVQLNPKHIAAKSALGNLALRSGDAAEALKIANRLRAEHPVTSVGEVLAGDVYLATNQAQQAINAYSKALDQAPSSTLLLKLYDAQRKMGKTEAAFKTLNDWLEKNPEDATVQRSLAFFYTERGETQAAINAYQRVLALRPNDSTVLNNLAWILYEQGDDRALAFAERAYKLAGGDVNVLDTYGWLLVQTGSAEQGIQLLTQATNSAPDRNDIKRRLIAAHAITKGNTQILAMIKRLDKHPQSPQAHNNFGLALAADGQQQAALASFETAIKIDPTLAETSVYIGDAYRKQDDYDQAIKHYQHALSIDVNIALAHQGLGVAMSAKNNPTEAVKHFSTALKMAPDLADTHQYLGGLFEEQGRINEASHHYAEALRLRLSQ